MQVENYFKGIFLFAKPLTKYAIMNKNEKVGHEMKAILTVIGMDKVGIVASVSQLLQELNINILDISQTIMEENFTMMMMVDITDSTVDIAEAQTQFKKLEKKLGVTIRLQREDLFQAMHQL